VPDGIDVFGNPELTYVQVANKIARKIEVGEYSHKLPAERALAQEFEVAYQTARHAIKLLREQGLIITRHGRGSFVKAGTGAIGADESTGSSAS
jgi:DNA-binding GntR family transcriptional regulator